MNVPSVAVSICNNGASYHFSPLAQAVEENLAQFIALWDPSHFININGPNHAAGPRNIVLTHLCLRVYSESPVLLDLPSGDQCWFLEGKPACQESDPGSDFEAVQNGHISLSPVYTQPVTHTVNRRYEAAYTRG